MGKFAQSIRKKEKEPTILISAPVFIPLEMLDAWRPDILSGTLPIDGQMQLYYQVGVHSYVVNKLCEAMATSGADKEQILDMIRTLYTDGVMAVNQSVHREAVATTYKQ
jgi:hypothetical protein